jgi:hypothetical protein
MSRDGRNFVIRDYLRAYLYDAPVSAAALARPTPVELPFQPQGEAVTFAPGDRALLVAGERDDALWWVPLTSASSASPSASGSASSPGPSGPVSPAPSAAPADGPAGVGPPALALALAALVGAAVVAAVAARRLRR